MIAVVVLLTLAPTLVVCSGEGNIHLLENEVAIILKACSNDKSNGNDDKGKRDRRSNNKNVELIKQNSQYNDANSSNVISDNLNITDNKIDDFAKNYTENQQSKTTTYTIDMKTNRTRRSEPLFIKPDTDQCLSQCVFANLQVVDPRGIPRESELWNLVQSSVTSQQSRAALRDQIRACFQELQSESEENGCSFSNKLERCLMLRFSDRLITGKEKTQKNNK